ncbi:MAG: murein hydrolase activator EnvC family protein [Candidatus Kerfeldbacteria bacterium]
MALFSINKIKIESLNMLKVAGLTVLLGIFLLIPTVYVMAQEEITEEVNSTETESTTTESLNVLNQELTDKKDAIEELKKKSDIYAKNIKVKQQESLTLQSQMQLIELQVGQTENDIETVREEIDKVGIELDTLKITLAEKDIELAYRQDVLANYIRLIDEQDQQSYLEVIISNQSFSDFFDDMQHTQDLQSNVKDALSELKITKQTLEDEQTEKIAKKDELDELTEKLSSSISNLNSQQDYKVALLEDTQESEERFSILLDEALREQQAAEGEINTLESRVRDKLEEGGVDLDIEAVLMWPIPATRGISAYFHDPSYPFRRLFEHPAIDIPASQGTNIRASESGYVARAKNAGLGYSYIMIVHNNEISTVYGHTSRIDVIEDEYVVRGQIIGAVGGTPGTPGAGRLTTGPHLHFEVRSGGIPVNPLDYLP